MSPQNALVRTFSDYFILAKPRIAGSVLLAAAVGYYLGRGGAADRIQMVLLLLGAGLACCGASVLNQYLEKDHDAQMEYARDRPLPAGRISPVHALNFGVILVLAGLLILWMGVNLLTAFISLLSAFLYVVIYTPLKRVSWLNTSLGAIAGALPPVGGWAAAGGKLSWEAGILFLFLFIWQHPHFYSIAWVRREDYRRAGFKMLSTVDTADPAIFRHILFFSLFLIPVSALTVIFVSPGSLWGWAGVLLAAAPAVFSVRFMRSRSESDGRMLFKASVAYLPAFFVLIILAAGF